MEKKNIEEMSVLVTKYQNGDKDAFAEIYELTDGELRAYAYGKKNPFRNSDMVEDILQETYIKIINNIDKLQNASSYMGWAKRIFINTLYSEFRPTKYQEVVQETVEEKKSTRSVVDEVIFRDEVMRVVEAADDLSDVQRETFVAFYIDGTLIEDIARDMNCSKGTVKTRLFSARNKLRERIC